MGLVTACGALGQWPIGRLSDRVDRRLVLIGLLVAAAIVGLLFAVLPVTGTVWFVLAVFFGLAIAPTYSIAAAHAYDHAQPGQLRRDGRWTLPGQRDRIDLRPADRVADDGRASARRGCSCSPRSFTSRSPSMSGRASRCAPRRRPPKRPSSTSPPRRRSAAPCRRSRSRRWSSARPTRPRDAGGRLAGRRTAGRPAPMRRSLFALLRGVDGRSLARALAALVFVNALIAGLHGGMLAQAATSDTPVICALAGGQDTPANPASDDDHRACCLLGCISAAATVVPPTSPELAGLPSSALGACRACRPRPARRTPHPIEGPASPRGPPLLV